LGQTAYHSTLVGLAKIVKQAAQHRPVNRDNLLISTVNCLRSILPAATRCQQRFLLWLNEPLLSVTLVLAQETNSPKSRDAIHWKLITNLEVDSLNWASLYNAQSQLIRDGKSKHSIKY
jgi:type VI protein secretion system component VasA